MTSLGRTAIAAVVLALMANGPASAGTSAVAATVTSSPQPTSTLAGGQSADDAASDKSGGRRLIDCEGYTH